jgi:hypothetical protein
MLKQGNIQGTSIPVKSQTTTLYYISLSTLNSTLYLNTCMLFRNEPNTSIEGEGTETTKCKGVQSRYRKPHMDGKSITPSSNGCAERAVWL